MLSLDQIHPTQIRAAQARNRLRNAAYHKDGTVKDAKIAAIHEQVRTGEISPHAGMIQAGFRPLSIAIYPNNPPRTDAVLRRRLGEDQYARLVLYLNNFLLEFSKDKEPDVPDWQHIADTLTLNYSIPDLYAIADFLIEYCRGQETP